MKCIDFYDKEMNLKVNYSARCRVDCISIGIGKAMAGAVIKLIIIITIPNVLICSQILQIPRTNQWINQRYLLQGRALRKHEMNGKRLISTIDSRTVHSALSCLTMTMTTVHVKRELWIHREV